VHLFSSSESRGTVRIWVAPLSNCAPELDTTASAEGMTEADADMGTWSGMMPVFPVLYRPSLPLGCVSFGHSEGGCGGWLIGAE